MPELRPITDAHLHLWDLERSPYMWMRSASPALRRTGTWGEAGPQLTGLGVRRVVLVQADDTPEDTQHMLAAAEAIEAGGPVRADVVGWLPLEAPEQVARALEDRPERLVGVRHLVHDEPEPDVLEREHVAASLRLLAEAGLPLDVPDAFPRHMEQVVRVARAHPRLTIVLDHLGKPPLGDEQALRTWRTQLRDIAARPGTVAKLSGLATSGDGTRRHMADAVLTALELFGPERLMVGSDWPIAPEPFRADGGFAVLLDVVEEVIGELGEDALQQVLTGTAERVYRRT